MPYDATGPGPWVAVQDCTERRRRPFVQISLNCSEDSLARIVGGPLTAPGHLHTEGD
jgi:hypothetical protein